MKRSPLFMLVSLIVVFAVGCANMTAGNNTSSNIDRIQKRGSIIIGTAANMPPLNMTTKKGVPAGLDIDLAQYIAGGMGVKLQLVTKNFADLLPALEAGQVDMVISGMTITPERNLKVDFAGPYHVTGKAFLAKMGAFSKIKNMGELNSNAFTFTALAGSTSEGLIKLAAPNAVYKPVNNYDEAVAMILENKADALVSDYHACLVALLRNPGKGLAGALTPFTYEPLGIALPQGDAHLLNWTTNFLNTMSASGELTALKFKWIEKTNWIDDLP
jgi:polar amino acid transport system substrate-binding protein